jgi:hypothetical protein
LEINKRTFGKSTSTWKLNNMYPNSPWIKEEIPKENRKYFELNENKNTNISK